MQGFPVKYTGECGMRSKNKKNWKLKVEACSQRMEIFAINFND